MSGGVRLRARPEVEVLLRRSARARQLSLRVSRLDGRVTLTIPSTTRLSDAQAFLDEKSGWLSRHLAVQPERVVVAPGICVPDAGAVVPVVAGAVRAPLRQDGKLIVNERRPAGPQVQGYFKHAARSRLALACDRYSSVLGRRYGQITLRDTRSRWGSCTSAGNLMFSWRLAMAPVAVLDYVAAHEVAHLVEMNHSRAFWNVVERLYRGHQAARDWLREHGAALHRYDFTAKRDP